MAPNFSTRFLVMSGPCSTIGRVAYRVLEGSHVEDAGENGKIILKWIFRR